jgi:hypothetical protein
VFERSDNRRLREYQDRLEDLMEATRDGIERQAPEVLDRLATTARNVARRLEDMATEGRQRAAENQTTPESKGTSEPPSGGESTPGT